MGVALLNRRSTQPPIDYGFTLNRQSQQAEGLIAWWAPNASKSFGLHRDMSLYGEDGSPNGGLAVAYNSQMGVGLKLNGSNSYVSIPYSDTLALVSSRLSIVAWFKTSTGLSRTIVGKPFAATHISPYFDWLMYLSNSKFNIRIGNASVLSTTAIVSNTLYHLVVIADGTNFYFYINGVLDTTSANATLPTNTNSKAIRIGANAAVGEVFDGEIYDIRLYNRPLSAAEVWDMYVPQTRWELYAPAPRFWSVQHVPNRVVAVKQAVKRASIF